MGPGKGKLTFFGIQQPPPIIVLDNAFLIALYLRKTLSIKSRNPLQAIIHDGFF